MDLPFQFSRARNLLFPNFFFSPEKITAFLFDKLMYMTGSSSNFIKFLRSSIWVLFKQFASKFSSFLHVLARLRSTSLPLFDLMQRVLRFFQLVLLIALKLHMLFDIRFKASSFSIFNHESPSMFSMRM
jgi:hypothetical protein